MGLFLWRDPGKWNAVYRPIVWQFFSDLYPTADAQLVFQVYTVRKPTAAELLSFPQLNEFSVLVDHSLADPSAFYVGSSVELYNTGGGVYNGVYKVLDRINNFTTVVDAEYAKDILGGDMRIHYTNFQVWVDVLSENMTEPVRFKLRPTVDAAGTTVFECDPRDAIARTFLDVKNRAIVQTDANIDPFIPADGYITQSYTLTAYEAYDVVDESGLSTFTVFGDDPLIISDQIAVNAVQPYHEVGRDGTVRLDWYDGLGDYILTYNGANGRRLLTHASQTSQFMTDADSHFMAFLWGGSIPGDLKLTVSYYSQPDAAAGSFISVDRIRGQVTGNSAICPMGPANLTVPAGTKSYKFAVANGNENIISDVFVFNIVPCKGANRRFYYLNKLGGVDAFTFQGDEERSLNVARSIVTKPHMETGYNGFNGDWQRRVWRTMTDRRYSIASNFLLPEQIHSITETLFESPNVWMSVTNQWWTPVLIFTNETPADGTSARAQRMSLEYGLGVDNVTQRT